MNDSHAQRAEEPQVDSFRVGDKWEFRETHVVASGSKTEFTSSYEIKSVSAGVLTFDDTSNWPTVDNPYPEAKAPWRMYPLEVGKSWRFSHAWRWAHGESVSTFRNAKVVSLETVVVPAGTFLAYKIEYQGEQHQAGENPVSMSETHWYAPAAKMSVKQVNRRGQASVSVELLAYTRGPKTSAK